MDVEPEDAWTAPRVVSCRYVASPQTVEREARVLRRWQVTRGWFWVRWGLTWLAFIATVLVAVDLLVRWLAPEASDFLLWAALLGVAMMLAAAVVDAVTLPSRWLRRLLVVVERQTPPGAVVEHTFEPGHIDVTTPTAGYAIPTRAITRATWRRDCLLVEAGSRRSWVLHGEGIDGDARRLLADVLGPRLQGP